MHGTIELFISILAGETGNVAVKCLATGGVYVAGGVAMHTLRAIERPAFMQCFKCKGRYADLMERIPVHVIVTPAGLAGVASADWRIRFWNWP